MSMIVGPLKFSTNPNLNSTFPSYSILNLYFNYKILIFLISKKNILDYYCSAFAKFRLFNKFPTKLRMIFLSF